MTTRVLEASGYSELNLRVYQDNGSLLAEIDLGADYKIVVFGLDPEGMGGNRLISSARSGPECVSADLFVGTCANAEPEPTWEEDLGEDPMASILEQPDAVERMEVELFTCLGGQIA
ncbi:hypothetical protein N7491_005106 [Penicillium cf. griseofulvum]|uniref:Uncharacterized protein n=1 Tax=Penicillium cf. griseofulvum TaxID=2972120 RepID=A0A9W9M4D4_9EURO|nr:hypothetical protein N7472_007799 [Penicillium cf. griseofulvum]KAJ5434511.1 hypothetical protein N7491_005106 [Penicillium cf. griseofulvum]KAJ5452341.1 hypothetical protein N7445_000524 [Penicillium cf. griseofulvum]